MRLVDISFTSPRLNLIFDEFLLYLAQKKGDSFLRFWEPEDYFIVLGKTSKQREELYSQKCKQDNIPVLRRCSGGASILQGRGCLNYAVVDRYESHPDYKGIKSCFGRILGLIAKALSKEGVRLDYTGISDLSFKGKKVSGNSQKRGKNTFLVHGTLLYNFGIERVDTYLKIPLKTPACRKNRTNLDFLTNIPASCESIKQAVIEAFGAQESCSPSNLRFPELG